jgi:transcriptional regulator with XRE-family HTH domain
MNQRAKSSPDPIDIAVGARIRLRRRQQDMSQTQLANLLGITFQQVQKYERGVNRISASMLVKAAAAMDTTVAALVGEDGSAQVEPVFLARLAELGAAELLAAYATGGGGEVRRALLTVVEAAASRGPPRGRMR